jgi:signal transduction histidine kinase
MLRLIIEDNGRGIGPVAAREKSARGLGLIGMRERAQALGGTFTIGDRDGGGTLVSVTIPLNAVAVAVDAAPTEPALRVG